MKKSMMIKAGMAVLMVGTLTACSTLQTTVYPKGGNKYTLIATARSDSEARQGAVNKATQLCQKQHKSLVVQNAKTVYQGAGKELGAVTEAASDAVFDVTGQFMGGGTKSNQDYKTTLNFICQ